MYCPNPGFWIQTQIGFAFVDLCAASTSNERMTPIAFLSGAEAPYAAVAAINGYLAFYPDRVGAMKERLDYAKRNSVTCWYSSSGVSTQSVKCRRLGESGKACASSAPPACAP